MFLQLPLEIEEKIWRMAHEMLLSECLKDDIWVDVFYSNRYHYFQFSNKSLLCYDIGTRDKEYIYIENNTIHELYNVKRKAPLIKILEDNGQWPNGFKKEWLTIKQLKYLILKI